MSTLKPGWAEALGKAAATQDEAARSDALGVKPRRAWRGNGDVRHASVVRGAHSSWKNRRALPPLFAEDVEGDE